MAQKQSGFINVDELMPQLTVEQVAAYYGVPLPELHRVGQEIRTKCFLSCGQAEQTGERALAIKADHPAKQWRCHQYGCNRGGNLISLCDLLKPGTHMDGKPRGERFKEIAKDLAEMAGGVITSEFTSSAPAMPKAEKSDQQPAPPANVPLKDSPNERARELINLHEQLVVEPAEMNPHAAAYFRQRPFLTPEVCKDWRIGYMPRGSKSSLRGKVVYPIHSPAGDVLTWFGRDPQYEEKRDKWIAGGRQGREPEKFRFVKGFHRGLELFGQERMADRSDHELLRHVGLPVVEGANDVIALSMIGVPSVGLTSNTITAEQVDRIATMAATYAEGQVLLLLDCDEEGERGAKQALWELSQHVTVRLGWSRSMHDGEFAGRQPESLSFEEFQRLQDFAVGQR